MYVTVLWQCPDVMFLNTCTILCCYFEKNFKEVLKKYMCFNWVRFISTLEKTASENGWLLDATNMLTKMVSRKLFRNFWTLFGIKVGYACLFPPFYLNLDCYIWECVTNGWMKIIIYAMYINTCIYGYIYICHYLHKWNYRTIKETYKLSANLVLIYVNIFYFDTSNFLQ